jgi:hypothetical protein
MDVDSSPPEADGLPEPSFAETRAARVCSWIVFALVMLHSLNVLHFYLWKVPAFESVFAGICVSLPTITRYMLSRTPLWVVAILAAAGLAKELPVKNRLVTLAVNGVHLVLLVATCWFLETAFLMPLLQLLSSMGE